MNLVLRRTNVHVCPSGKTSITVLRGRFRGFRVYLWPDGRIEVRDTTMTVAGRVIGGREYGMPFRGSSDAREAVIAAMDVQP